MILKKLIVFFMVIFAVIGFVTVDAAYSDMLDLEGKIGLEVKRIDEDYLSMSIFGKVAEINTTEVARSWNEFSETVVAGLNSATTGIRRLAGIEEERDYSVFQLQML
ncbi:MAG: hypothetical protein ACOX5F_04090 [Anaerovoracaceae bacterium]|jgi:hypothetical protein